MYYILFEFCLFILLCFVFDLVLGLDINENGSCWVKPSFKFWDYFGGLSWNLKGWPFCFQFICLEHLDFVSLIWMMKVITLYNLVLNLIEGFHEKIGCFCCSDFGFCLFEDWLNERKTTILNIIWICHLLDLLQNVEYWLIRSVWDKISQLLLMDCVVFILL